MMSKKFKFLRNEAVKSSWVMINIINIYDNRGIENFSKSWEEILSIVERPTTLSDLQRDIIPICVIIKSTSNFLLKLNENELIENLKKLITSKGITKIMEIDDDTNFDADSFIQDIIFLCNN